VNGSAKPEDTATIPTQRVVPDAHARSLERDELDAVYTVHQRDLYAFALRTTRDHDAAEDAVAEAFARLLREWRRGHRPDNVGGWLFRVTANVILSGRRRRAVADRWRAVLGRGAPAAAADPELEALAHEQRSELESTLAVLPPEARAALLLAANGFHSAEIAAAIGRSDGATRTLLCRSRMRMRELLEAGEVAR
jgi:RNA polymerase sigma-70 factor (ECF subfamily)